MERKCDAEFVRTLKAHSVEINGKISARIVCETAVTINKGGYLEGTVYARSISVEKGGVFSGELFIGQPEPGGEQRRERHRSSKGSSAMKVFSRPESLAKSSARR